MTTKEAIQAMLDGKKVKRLKEANSELRKQIKLLQSNSCLKAKDNEIKKLKEQYHQCLDDYIKCAERNNQ